MSQARTVEQGAGSITPGDGSAAYRAPQQARTRRVLEDVLTAACELLESEGPDDFNMAAVADRAGVSIGAIYRRFQGREQLLTAVKARLLAEFEATLSADLHRPHTDLASIIRTFTNAMADGVSRHPRAFPTLLQPIGKEATERGHSALINIRLLFLDAACAHHDEIRRSDPAIALTTVQGVITSACVHRGMLGPDLNDGLSWPTFAHGLADMAVTYLLTADSRTALSATRPLP
ncbi:MAG: TetR/AcrR family transcriptional regulator [Phycicoccus sp.]|nr:TetR/AcrR family transcriptional regulator [Phycicoccus sp.]